MANAFFLSDAIAEIEGLLECKSRFLPEADGGKGVASACRRIVPVVHFIRITTKAKYSGRPFRQISAGLCSGLKEKPAYFSRLSISVFQSLLIEVYSALERFSQ